METGRLLLANQVSYVLIVLCADEFEDLFVRQICHALLGPRSLKNPWVVDRDFDFQMAEIWTVVALDNMKFIGVRVSFDVEPDSGVERDAIYYQGVAVPAADGVPVPSRVRVSRMAAPVQIDLMEAWALVI